LWRVGVGHNDQPIPFDSETDMGIELDFYLLAA